MSEQFDTSGDVIPAPGRGIERRAFMGSLVLGSLAHAQCRLAADGGNSDDARKTVPPPAMISRQKNPDNIEFPFSSLDDFLTPNERFFVRNHFKVPELKKSEWRLSVEGAVEKPFALGFDELLQMPSRSVIALLECSGNSRVFLKPPQVGVRWEQGAVGNGEWTGVPLAAVLERAGVKRGALEVIAEGADKGKYEPPDQKTPGEIHFARSLPLAKARQPEVLLAYRMNGRDLTADHGFPVRLVVPGWYGMASVKWLTRLHVVDRHFHGFFQTFQYAVWERRGGIPDLVPVTAVAVKAQVARPALGEVIATGTQYRMFGAAWAGEADVTKVEVSTDGGVRWQSARLLEKPIRYAWRLWEHDWSVPAQPGQLMVMARATDSQGRVQPMERDDDRRDAMISHVQPIIVEVK